MMMFYLFSVITGSYLGPLDQRSCMAAAAPLAAYGIACREAKVMAACPVPGRPDVFTACPQFDVPQVTLKPKEIP